ncbi:MAG: MipA/OmpV family protein [Comamonadaceae bacterium]|jgi:outer membrane scaffolding protein for murein synthesis (MipA/OmpV family)|nr:MipA/OmpV family protein [Comamonadaceae bacterium]
MKSLLLLLAAGAVVLPAAAQQTEQAPEDQPARYLLGVSVADRPEYDGASTRQTKIRPLWAVQWGRWRISTSGGSALLGFGRDGAGAGASTLLIDRSRLRLGLSLRVDSGRSSGDASTTQGLPDVKRTLRARLYANYSLAPDWNLSANLSQDLLGRKGGLTAGVDLGWRFYRSATLEWAAGAGLSAGNAQNLRSYFGVPESAVASSGKPAYEPGGGLRDLHAGVSFTRSLSKHWFAFGGVGANQLLGPVADSPLVQQRNGSYANLGLAWRN